MVANAYNPNFLWAEASGSPEPGNSRPAWATRGETVSTRNAKISQSYNLIWK